MNSSSKVKRLPGSCCFYFRKGRCLYDEMLNPGYQERFRCRVLRQWEDAYDEFLDRAEAFHLDEAQSSRIWAVRLEKMSDLASQCPLYEARESFGEFVCAKAFGFLCLDEFPVCEGRCQRFLLPPRAKTDLSLKE